MWNISSLVCQTNQPQCRSLSVLHTMLKAIHTGVGWVWLARLEHDSNTSKIYNWQLSHNKTYIAHHSELLRENNLCWKFGHLEISVTGQPRNTLQATEAYWRLCLSQNCECKQEGINSDPPPELSCQQALTVLLITTSWEHNSPQFLYKSTVGNGCFSHIHGTVGMCHWTLFKSQPNLKHSLKFLL